MDSEKLTKIELQMRLASLQLAKDKAKAEGHPVLVRECQRVISAYKSRIKRMKDKDNGNA